MVTKGKKHKKGVIYIILAIIALAIIFYLMIKYISVPEGSFSQEGVDRTNCPYKIEGNPNATFIIKYVDSPYCIWCWLEEPILKRLVATKGKSFKLERYDIRYCSDIVITYRLSGTPSFVFSSESGTKEYPYIGYMGEETLNKIICGVTGDC